MKDKTSMKKCTFNFHLRSLKPDTFTVTTKWSNLRTPKFVIFCKWCCFAHLLFLTQSFALKFWALQILETLRLQLIISKLEWFFIIFLMRTLRSLITKFYAFWLRKKFALNWKLTQNQSSTRRPRKQLFRGCYLMSLYNEKYNTIKVTSKAITSNKMPGISTTDKSTKMTVIILLEIRNKIER